MSHKVGVHHITCRAYQGVFGHRDCALHRGGLVDLLIEFQVLYDGLYQRTGVGLVIYGERVGISYAVGIRAQQACEDAVESAHPEAPCGVAAYKAFDALTHLLCSLVGECKRHYAPWLESVAEQVHYLVGEHAGFARAGTRYHKLGTVEIHHGITLLRIELCEIVLHVGCLSDEFIKCRIIYVTYSGYFCLEFLAVHVEVIAKLVEAIVFIAQLGVHHAEQDYRVGWKCVKCHSAKLLINREKLCNFATKCAPSSG